MNVQVNGVILYYEKQGSGPPLVLLHGNGEDGRIFRQPLPRQKQPQCALKL